MSETKIIDGHSAVIIPKKPITKPVKGKLSPARGRPSTYDPKYCDVIVQVARRGGDDAAMALACGLSNRKSLWNWRQEHAEFQEAYNYAKLITLERDEALLDGFILGKVKGGNFNALHMRLRHQDPEKYGSLENKQITNATQININGDIQTINQMAMEDLDKRIKEAMFRLGPILENGEEENGD